MRTQIAFPYIHFYFTITSATFFRKVTAFKETDMEKCRKRTKILPHSHDHLQTYPISSSSKGLKESSLLEITCFQMLCLHIKARNHFFLKKNHEAINNIKPESLWFWIWKYVLWHNFPKHTLQQQKAKGTSTEQKPLYRKAPVRKVKTAYRTEEVQMISSGCSTQNKNSSALGTQQQINQQPSREVGKGLRHLSKEVIQWPAMFSIREIQLRTRELPFHTQNDDW